MGRREIRKAKRELLASLALELSNRYDENEATTQAVEELVSEFSRRSGQEVRVDRRQLSLLDVLQPQT